MSLNELGEKWLATIFLGKFVNKPKSKFKARSHDIFFSWTFDLLLINTRYLVFRVYFLPHQRNIIVCKYKLNGKPIMKYQSWTCFWYWCWKNLFFNVKLKLVMINFNFSQFHEHIFESSRSQTFFKIGALKNYAIQNYEFKRDSNTGVLL